MPVKYVFVTGGVVSGLGKGITAASLGRLLKARGYKVTMQKFDPYINIDPGTMNPIQHGEVFVTDDGAETDLDLGHYERFIDESLTKNSNVTTGKKWNDGDNIYRQVYTFTESINNPVLIRLYSAMNQDEAQTNPGDVYIEWVKIERGSIPTPWTPDPSDPDQQRAVGMVV